MMNQHHLTHPIEGWMSQLPKSLIKACGHCSVVHAAKRPGISSKVKVRGEARCSILGRGLYYGLGNMF